MRVALDALGGDHGPAPNLQGAASALRGLPDLTVVAVGEPGTLEPHLASAELDADRFEVVPCVGSVGMDEKPTVALREKPECSLAVMWKLLAEKQVDAVVSAGNTGAVVAAGLRTRQFLKPVKRPGIAVPLPTSAGRSVLMDCGANPHAKPEHLFQYGVIGAVYAREILGIERPRIGTLNIGSEEGKGNELVGETHELFKSAGSLPGEYVGYVEGRGIYHGEADVTVCEGFVGNVVLKVSEGFAQYLLRAVGEGLVGAGVLGPEDAMKTVGGVGRRFAYQATGGAPLLGVDGACLIAHGSSDGDAIANAIKAAAEMVSKDVNGQIVAALGG